MSKGIRHWWKEDEDTIPESINGIIGELDSEQGYRTSANLRNLRMYTNLAVLGLSASEYASDESAMPTDRLTLNVVESVIETAKALISTNKPKIRFLTEGGSRKQRRKAQDMTRFASGQFHAAGTYSKAQDSFGDACSMGTGFLRIYEEDNEVKTERVFTDEIMIDDVEGKYGEPRSLYMHKEIERTVLEAVYPKKSAELAESGQMRQEGAFLMGLADPVGVVEAWHLPSKKGAKDGRHIITCDNTCLFSEEWSGSRFPFAVFRWTTRPLGFWGKGIPEILRGIQIEINMILQKTQRLMNLASSKVFVQKGSKVNTAKLNNEEWGIVEYAGEKPPCSQQLLLSPQSTQPSWNGYMSRPSSCLAYHSCLRKAESLLG